MISLTFCKKIHHIDYGAIFSWQKKSLEIQMNSVLRFSLEPPQSTRESRKLIEILQLMISWKKSGFVGVIFYFIHASVPVQVAPSGVWSL